MRRIIIGITIAGGLGVLALAQEGDPITGAVFNDSGRPVSGAIIRYTDDFTQEVHTTTTRSDGSFVLPAGLRGVVSATARDLGTLRRVWPPRDGGSRLRFDLVPPATVRGILLDAMTRQPINGTVTVHVGNPINTVSSSMRVEDGVFEFINLPPGRAAIYAFADGFAPRFDSMTVEAGRTYQPPMDLMLEAVAAGILVDSQGEPVEGAEIRVGYDRSVEGASILAGLVRGFVRTDENGVFRIRGLIPDMPIAFQAQGVDGRVSDVVSVTAIEPGFQQNGLSMSIR